MDDHTTPPPRPTEPAHAPPPPSDTTGGTADATGRVRWRLLAADILDLLTVAMAAAAVAAVGWIWWLQTATGWDALGLAIVVMMASAAAALLAWIVLLVFTYRSRSVGQRLLQANSPVLPTVGRHIGVLAALTCIAGALAQFTEPQWYAAAAAGGFAAAGAAVAVVSYLRPLTNKTVVAAAAGAAVLAAAGSVATPDRAWFSWENERHARQHLRTTMETSEVADVRPVLWCDQPVALAAPTRPLASHATAPCNDPDAIWLVEGAHPDDVIDELTAVVHQQADGRYDVGEGTLLLDSLAAAAVGQTQVTTLQIVTIDGYHDDLHPDDLAVVMPVACGTAVAIDDNLLATHARNIAAHPRC